jgi:ABC-type polysaccharide/polyol phosphate transport system ATPase subunit
MHSIVVDNVTKAYKLYDRPVDRLKESLHPFKKTYHRLFHALKDVSFAIEQGESVGIVGQNGAGKSTLLKIITGVLTPSSGNIQVNGHVSALLELGTGFNQELTGLENIFFNGAIMGFSREEMEARIDDILSFADIGDFVHQPIKTYSSGMVMRLGFAVSVCVEPQIMIVDEMLAVGDAPFQAKCFTRLRKLIDSGVTILFTSHDISTVRSLCKRALWLEEGKTQMWGDAKEVCREYEKACWKKQGVVLGLQTDTAIEEHEKLLVDEQRATLSSSVCEKSLKEKDIVELPPFITHPNEEFIRLAKASRYGTGALIVKNLVLTDSRGNYRSAFDYNEEATAHYLIEAHQDVNSDFVIGVRIKNLKGDFVLSVHDIWQTHNINITKGQVMYAKTSFKLPLTHAGYSLLTGIFGFQDGSACNTENNYDFSRAVMYDIIENAFFFKIHQCSACALSGPVHFNASLEYELISAKGS